MEFATGPLGGQTHARWAGALVREVVKLPKTCEAMQAVVTGKYANHTDKNPHVAIEAAVATVLPHVPEGERHMIIMGVEGKHALEHLFAVRIYNRRRGTNTGGRHQFCLEFDAGLGWLLEELQLAAGQEHDVVFTRYGNVPDFIEMRPATPADKAAFGQQKGSCQVPAKGVLRHAVNAMTASVQQQLAALERQGGGSHLQAAIWPLLRGLSAAAGELLLPCGVMTSHPLGPHLLAAADALSKGKPKKAYKLAVSASRPKLAALENSTCVIVLQPKEGSRQVVIVTFGAQGTMLSKPCELLAQYATNGILKLKVCRPDGGAVAFWEHDRSKQATLHFKPVKQSAAAAAAAALTADDAVWAGTAGVAAAPPLPVDCAAATAGSAVAAASAACAAAVHEPGGLPVLSNGSSSRAAAAPGWQQQQSSGSLLGRKRASEADDDSDQQLPVQRRRIRSSSSRRVVMETEDDAPPDASPAATAPPAPAAAAATASPPPSPPAAIAAAPQLQQQQDEFSTTAPGLAGIPPWLQLQQQQQQPQQPPPPVDVDMLDYQYDFDDEEELTEATPPPSPSAPPSPAPSAPPSPAPSPPPPPEPEPELGPDSEQDYDSEEELEEVVH